MARKKVTRKELLKGTDEFLTFSAKAAMFVSEHSRHFAYVGVALAVVALIYLGINSYLRYINKKGQDIYNRAYYALVENMRPDADQKALQQSEEFFQQVRDKYGMSKAARLSLAELAYLKFLSKKYDEAISLYQEFLKELSDNSPYESLTRIALAACYEAQRDFTKAIETLEQILAGPNDFSKQQAMLQLARVCRLDNQQGRSKDILKDFTEKFKSSPYLPLVKSHLK